VPKLFNEIKNKFSNNPINLSSKEKNMIAKKIAEILFVFLTSLILKKY
jgi:hypothetical protein